MTISVLLSAQVERLVSSLCRIFKGRPSTEAPWPPHPPKKNWTTKKFTAKKKCKKWRRKNCPRPILTAISYPVTSRTLHTTHCTCTCTCNCTCTCTYTCTLHITQWKIHTAQQRCILHCAHLSLHTEHSWNLPDLRYPIICKGPRDLGNIISVVIIEKTSHYLNFWIL